MSFFTVQVLQEKLSRLSLSQDSIETLSLWIIHHKAHATTSIDVWMEDMRKANADRRLMLFYLANDVLQNSRRRGANMFQDLFRDPLRSAVSLVRGQKIQTSVERMFRIWKERRVYDNAFLKELELLIEPARKSEVSATKSAPSFKLALMEDSLTELRKFEAELKVKSSYLTNLRVDISDPTASLSQLKDKSEGGRVSSEFEEASQKLQDYSECLGIEVNERINILDMLKECEDYHSHCLVEVQKTSFNYKQLGKKVKGLRSKLHQRMKELERAQSTSTSDPTAKEDITDVGDMEIESDNEDSLLPSAPTATGLIHPPPSAGLLPLPSAATNSVLNQPQPLLSQTGPSTFTVQSAPLLQQPPKPAPSGTLAASSQGGSGTPNLNVAPASIPPVSHQPFAQSPHRPPPQISRQSPRGSNFPVTSNIPPGSNFPPRTSMPAGSAQTNIPVGSSQPNVPPGSNIPPRPGVPPGSNLPSRPTIPPGSNISLRPNVPSGSNIRPQGIMPPGSNVAPRANVPPGSSISSRPGVPPITSRPTFPMSANPPRPNIPPGSNVPPRPNVPLRSSAPPGSHIPPRSTVPPGSNIPPRPTIPPGSSVPLRPSGPPGSNIPPRPTVPPGSNIPPRPTVPHGSPRPSVYHPGSNIPPRPSVPPGSNIPPRTTIPPGPNVPSVNPPGSVIQGGTSFPPGANVPPRFQRPPFPQSAGVRTSTNVPPGGPPQPVRFSGPSVRPRYPPPANSPMALRQPAPLQGGTAYENTNSQSHFPPTTSSPASAPPPQKIAPLEVYSPDQYSASENTPSITSQPGQPPASDDSSSQDSVDLLTRSQTGLDQRLKNMMAQRMFSGVLNEFGGGAGGSSSDGDEKPYSPASDQPDIPLSNTGTPKLEEEEDDVDSIPTPDSGTVTPDGGASPQINMNNPILQALYSSSPDEKPKSEASETVPNVASMKVDPVADIDTEYLQGILNTVKSTSSSQKETPIPTSEPPQVMGTEAPALPETPPKQTTKLAAIKDIKITPTVTNLLGELFPQLSKTLQQNRKRKQDGTEEEVAVVMKNPRIEDAHSMPPGNIASSTPSELAPPRPPPGMAVPPPRPNFGPPQQNFVPPRPGMPRPGPRPMPRGMPPPGFRQDSPRHMYPPPPRGPPQSFRGPPPPRGPPSMIRHEGPPPPRHPPPPRPMVGSRMRAPYPPPSNHAGPIPPGAYPPQLMNRYKDMTNQQRTSEDGDFGGASFRAPPYQGPGPFRPPRYV